MRRGNNFKLKEGRFQTRHKEEPFYNKDGDALENDLIWIMYFELSYS